MRHLPLAAGTAALLALGLGPALAQGAGKPANLCKELVAYVHPPAPAPAAPAAAPAGQPPAVAAAAPPQGQSQGQQTPSAAAGDTQQKAGLSGPVPNSGPGAAGPQGTAQGAAPQPATAAAPAAAPPPAKPTPEMIAAVDAAAEANDLAGCRQAARRMRVAGIPLPAPLLALSALDLKFLQAAQ
ncbi:hypothetical protein [Methylobacterium sp. A54F]